MVTTASLSPPTVRILPLNYRGCLTSLPRPVSSTLRLVVKKASVDSVIVSPALELGL